MRGPTRPSLPGPYYPVGKPYGLSPSVFLLMSSSRCGSSCISSRVTPMTSYHLLSSTGDPQRRELMRCGRHRLSVTRSSSQAKQTAFALRSISRRMSSSTWIPNHQRESSQRSPLHTSPCNVQSDFETCTRTNGPERAHLQPQMVRSAVLPPLSTVEVSSNQPLPPL